MKATVRTISCTAALLVGVALVAPATALAADPAAPAAPAAAPASTPAAAPATAAAPAATTAPAAPAAPTKAQIASAKKHVAAADKLYKANDFDGAQKEYAAAEADAPSAESAHGIAVTQEKLGHAQDAVAAYSNYLTRIDAPTAKGLPPKHTKAQEDEMAAATTAIDTLKKTPGKLHVDSDPAGADVKVDGLDASHKAPFDLDLAPGVHTLHATADGSTPADQTVEVAYAANVTTTVKLSPLPPPPPPVVATPAPIVAPVQTPAPVEEKPSLVPAIACGGVAVAAVVVGTVFGAMALSDKSDFDKNPTSSKADDGETHALVADVAFGVAVTMAATSAILFLTRDEAAAPPSPPPAPTAKNGDAKAVAKAASKPSFSLAPFANAHGGGAGALIKF